MIISKDTELFLSVSQTPGNFGARVYNALFQEFGINAIYLPRLAPTNPRELCIALRTLGASGCSVSMPLKRTIAPHLEKLDSIANTTGVVNTVVHKQGRLFGYNTDAAGIYEALEGVTLHSVLIYGTGATLSSACYALRQRGASQIAVCGRTEAQAITRSRELGIANAGPVSCILAEGRCYNLLMNLTPGSVEPGNEVHQLVACADTIFDAVMTPHNTLLVSSAQSQGKPTIAGTDMYCHQVRQQFAIYTGRSVELSKVRELVKQR